MTESITIVRRVDPETLVPGDEVTPDPELPPDEIEYDEQGNPVYDETVSIVSAGWAAAPSFENEDQVTFGSYPVTGMRLYNRSAVDVRPDDVVLFRGERWAVVGDAADWKSPYSGFEGTVIAIAQVS